MADEEYLHTKIKELFMTVETLNVELKDLALKVDSLKRQNDGLMEEWKKKTDSLFKEIEQSGKEFFSTNMKKLEDKITTALKTESPPFIGDIKGIQSDLERQEKVNEAVRKSLEMFNERTNYLRDHQEKTLDVFSKRILRMAIILGKKDLLSSHDLATIIPSVTKNEKKFLRRKLVS
jgi:hypothetical protein